MATSKGRGSAASKSTATKVSKSAGSTAGKGAAGKGAALKKSAPAKSVSAKGTTSKSTASKSTASKSATGSKGAAASKSPASKATASKKSVAPKSAAASRGAAASSTRSNASASRNGSASSSAAGRGRATAATSGARGGAASKPAAPRTGKGPAKGAPAADPRNDLGKILQDLMQDIYYAEKKLSKALGKMAKNATNSQLKDAFTIHQAQTGDQVAKLEQAFESIGQKAKAKRCAAMDGLLEEANEHIEEYEKGAGLDAALIVGAQKVEHYEIAAYGSMRSIAKTLGYSDASRIFEEIREQESDTDEMLTTIAESVVNLDAEGETKDVTSGDKAGDSSGDSGGASSGGRIAGSEDSDAGEDSSSATTGNESDRGGNNDGDKGDSENDGTGRGAISSLTDGNDRGEASDTGEAMGY